MVEHWLEKSDIQYGDVVIPEGTWMIGVKVPNGDIWKSLKVGDRTGASIEGTGTRVEV